MRGANTHRLPLRRIPTRLLRLPLLQVLIRRVYDVPSEIFLSLLLLLLLQLNYVLSKIELTHLC